MIEFEYDPVTGRARQRPMSNLDRRELNRLSFVMGEIRRCVIEGKKLDPVDPLWDGLMECTRMFKPNQDPTP